MELLSKQENIILKETNNNNSKDVVISKPKYKVFETEIGEGTFGNVYYGINLKNCFPMAIKLIKDDKINYLRFIKEIKFLKEFKNEIFFPKCFYFEFSKKNKIIAQSLLGPNLKNLLKLCGGKFPLYTILNISVDLLKRIEIIHEHGIIHGDIKSIMNIYKIKK